MCVLPASLPGRLHVTGERCWWNGARLGRRALEPPGAAGAGAGPALARTERSGLGAALGAERVSFASASLLTGLSCCRFPLSESGAGDGVSSRLLLREVETKPTGKPSQKKSGK